MKQKVFLSIFIFYLPLFLFSQTTEELSYLEAGERPKITNKNKNKPVFRYNAIYSDYQLHVFNFDYYRPNYAVTPFIAIGLNYNPFGIVYQAGVIGGNGRFNLRLYYSGTVRFVRVEQTLQNIVNFELRYNLGPVILANTLSYGTIWLHRQNTNDAYLLNASHSIRNRFSLSAFLLHNGYLDIRYLAIFNYHYTIDERANLYELEMAFPMSFQLSRYFDWDMELGAFFTASDTDGIGLRQSFFDHSLSRDIIDDEEITGSNQNYGYESVWGVWFSLKPRIYFLQALKVNTSAKGIFLRPVIDLGIQSQDLRDLSNVSFLWTVGGGAGYRFPGGSAIVVDVGHNNIENLVIRLFGNANF